MAVPRQSIQDYAHQHALTWVEDESNQDTQFDRNFLRQQVMPLLTKRWPKFTASAARSASLCAEQESVLSELMLEQLASIEASERRLNLRQLATHSDASQKILVRAWLNKYGHDMPSAAVLNEILTMHEVSIDGDPIIALAQGQIRRYAEHLYLLTNGELEQINLAASFQAYDLSIDEQGEQIYAQWGFAISAQNCTENNSCKADIDALNVTFGRFSRRLKCHADRPNKSLKTWMQEWQIPPWQRASIPVICSADEIVCVILPHGQLKPNLDYQHNSDHSVFIKPL